MIYKKIVPHSKHTVFITKMNQLMLFNAIIAGYSDNRTKETNDTVWGKTVGGIQGVPGGKDLTSGECSLGQTIPI